MLIMGGSVLLLSVPVVGAHGHSAFYQLGAFLLADLFALPFVLGILIFNYIELHAIAAPARVLSLSFNLGLFDKMPIKRPQSQPNQSGLAGSKNPLLNICQIVEVSWH
jgi:hypothetical protein